jgi:hypothetical protein
MAVPAAAVHAAAAGHDGRLPVAYSGSGRQLPGLVEASGAGDIHRHPVLTLDLCIRHWRLGDRKNRLQGSVQRWHQVAMTRPNIPLFADDDAD